MTPFKTPQLTYYESTQVIKILAMPIAGGLEVTTEQEACPNVECMVVAGQSIV